MGKRSSRQAVKEVSILGRMFFVQWLRTYWAVDIIVRAVAGEVVVGASVVGVGVPLALTHTLREHFVDVFGVDALVLLILARRVLMEVSLRLR